MDSRSVCACAAGLCLSHGVLGLPACCSLCQRVLLFSRLDDTPWCGRARFSWVFFCGWMKSLSRIRLFATPWTVAYQASPSMGFSRQEYWSGLPFPSPRVYITFTFHFRALEKEMATHSSVLAWRIPWMEKPGRLQSTGLQRVRHD